LIPFPRERRTILISFPRERGKVPGGRKGAVRRQGLQYIRKHVVRMRQHVVIPESKNSKAKLFQHFIAIFISRRSCMLATVYFNYQPGFKTSKIRYVRTNRMLSAKSEACELLAPRTQP
jgi:hypothetical protein